LPLFLKECAALLRFTQCLVIVDELVELLLGYQAYAFEKRAEVFSLIFADSPGYVAIAREYRADLCGVFQNP
jgi:hypothetical protein